MPKIYGKIIKGKEFMSFNFMNDQFDKYFKDEKKFQQLFVNLFQAFLFALDKSIFSLHL